MPEKIKNILFVLILGSVSSLALLGIKSHTYPIIEYNRKKQIRRLLLEMNNPNEHYVFEFKGQGFWGMIEGLILLNQDLETIENIRIISQEETPGLGARITEENFLRQFQQKKVTPELKLAVRRKTEKENEIDAISGATMTSHAFIKIINRSIKKFKNEIQ